MAQGLAPRPAMPDLQALREDYRARKSLLLASLQASGSSTRGIRKLLQGLTREADVTLKALWTAADFPADFALLAVGGFGRGELFPHSDVDVLVLMPDGTSADHDPELKRKVEGFIGSCWDTGLEIGSSVRTVAECVAQAESDVTVQTSLLESRLLTGDAGLYSEFPEALRGHASTRGPSSSPRRWRCASATTSSRTRPTRWSPTARSRPAACATCR